MIIGAVAWCAASAKACSPPLNGGPTVCPPYDELPKPKPEPEPSLPREEMRGELDVYDINHWAAIQGMFIRNQRREQIEENATKPSDAIDSALLDFWNNDGV